MTSLLGAECFRLDLHHLRAQQVVVFERQGRRGQVFGSAVAIVELMGDQVGNAQLF